MTLQYMLGLGILYHLFPTSECHGLLCPKGVASFSNGAQSSTFYVCAQENEPPVLTKCERDRVYWAVKKICVPKPNHDNGTDLDLDNFQRPVLSNTAFLGDFFDSNTGKSMTGYSFWDSDTVNKHKKTKVTPSSLVDVFETKSTFDRLERANFNADVKVEVLGDSYELDGSCKYLKDQLESDKEVAVILTYSAATTTETLPVSVSPDHCYCERTTATHVITSVTYGIRANFLFKKSLGEGETRNQASRLLLEAVRGIQEDKADFDDSVVKILKDIRVKFYSDFVREKEPGNYDEAVKLYKTLPSHVGKYPNFANNTVSTQVALTPVTTFCQGKKVIHIAVADDVLENVSEMFATFESSKLTITTLLKAAATRTYSPLSDMLENLLHQLKMFQLRLKSDIRSVLPRIHTGKASEADLISLLNKYAHSPFNQKSIQRFLRNRHRELKMLDIIIDSKKISRTNIKICTYEEATDIETMFRKPFMLMLRFNVLPSDNLLQRFLQNDPVNEKTSWYNDPLMVSAMGRMFKQFVAFASANSESEIHGFVLAISDAKKGIIANDLLSDAIEVKGQKEGLFYDFSFPFTPLELTGFSTTHESVRFTVIRPSNTWITGFTISYRDEARKGEATLRDYKFSSTNVTTAKVDGLEANIRYGFRLQYSTPMGLSPPSSASIVFTRPCGPPSDLRIATLGSESVKLEWGAPTLCGKAVRISKYNVTINGVAVSRTFIIEHNTSAEVNRLDPGSKYTISVNGIAEKQSFNASRNVVLVTLTSSITIITRPDPPSHLSLVNISTHSATLQWFPPKHVASEGVIEKYLVKYSITNDLGDMDARGTEMVVVSFNTSCCLSDLVQGTTYAVSVQVLTSKGDSNYSEKLLMKSRFVKNELTLLKESMNKSVSRIESRIDNADQHFNALDNILPSLMVFYPRLRGEGNPVSYFTGCGGTINAGGGELKYPSHEGDVSTNNRHYEGCNWHIRTGFPTTLTNTYMHLCGDANIKIYDENKMIKKTGGSSTFGTIHTKSGNVFIEFRSGGSADGCGGFHISFTVAETKRMASKRYHPTLKATFTGYGAPNSYTEHHTTTHPKTNSSIVTCLRGCRQRFLADSAWNTVAVEVDTEPIQCNCYKNPTGFNYAFSKFQYRLS